MFIPLVDVLRCPKQHEETWLVASIDRAEERDIRSGTLGCPKCLAEYPVRDGVVIFADAVQRESFCAPSEEEATRLAAALDLTEPRMTALLHGQWGAHAPMMGAMTPAHLLLVNPPQGITSGEGISIVVAERAPVAQRSVDAVAIGHGAGAEMIASLLAALRGGKRVFGPVSLPLPDGLREFARDDEVWVAELQSATLTSAPIMPTRRRQ
jgi:uncharacterized protein YbaR (Trm112 family)